MTKIVYQLVVYLRPMLKILSFRESSNGVFVAKTYDEVRFDMNSVNSGKGTSGGVTVSKLD